MAVLNTSKGDKVRVTLNAGVGEDGKQKTSSLLITNFKDTATDQAVYDVVIALLSLQGKDVREILRQKNGALINQ